MAENTSNTSCSTKNDLTIINSQDLFGDGREVTIEHNGVAYRLMITRFGKLILTK